MVRHHPEPGQRQHVRRLPLADPRLRRHAAHRHRRRQQRRRRARPHGPAQPAAHAAGGEHRVRAQLDVQRALFGHLPRSVQRVEGRSRAVLPRRDTVWRPGAASIYGTSFDPADTTTLLAVQGNFPSTETIEVAGFSIDDPETYDPRIYYPPHVVSSGLVSDTVPARSPVPTAARRTPSTRLRDPRQGARSLQRQPRYVRGSRPSFPKRPVATSRSRCRRRARRIPVHARSPTRRSTASPAGTATP